MILHPSIRSNRMHALANPVPEPRRVTRLWHILRHLGVPVIDLAPAVHVDPRSVARWLSGRALPTGHARSALCRWLGERGFDLPFALELVDMADVTDLDSHRTAVAPPAKPKRQRPSRAKARPNSPETDIMNKSLAFLEPDDLDYFGLRTDPFEPGRDPEDVYMSDTLKKLDATLRQAVRRFQIVAIVGEPGAGKSTLVRRLRGRLRNDSTVRVIEPASLDRRRITHAALGVAILRDLVGKDTSSFSMESRSELLRSTLEEQTAAGIYPALLLDEAHHLKPDALLAIKQLWDSHALFRQLSVILIGQPALRARLTTDPTVKELNGRTRMLEVPPLADDVNDYLRWRFSRIGADADAVFEPSAYKALAVRAVYPMWINTLAVLSMQRARGLGDERVTATHVNVA